MRIAFDTTTLAFEKKTGTGVYCEELVSAFQNRFDKDRFFHTYRLVRALKGRKYFLNLTTNASRQILQDPWTAFLGLGYDVFHGLNARLPILINAKKIVTIHDLFSIFGNFSEEKFKADQKKKILSTLKRADHVIVPASFTKDQLIQLLHMDSKKISVVGEGVRQVYLQDFDKNEEKLKLKTKFNISTPYFLFVGTLEKRKNVTGLLRVFKKFKSQNLTSHKLVLVGGAGFDYESIQREMNDPLIKNEVLQLGFLSQEELATLYRAADAFLFLSFEEGFGIPVIEAMACGTAVISSNTTSLPEAGGGFTFLVDPMNEDQILEKIKNVISFDQAVRNQILEGKIYARKLTWEQVAENTRQVYEKVLKN